MHKGFTMWKEKRTIRLTCLMIFLMHILPLLASWLATGVKFLLNRSSGGLWEVAALNCLPLSLDARWDKLLISTLHISFERAWTTTSTSTVIWEVAGRDSGSS